MAAAKQKRKSIEMTPEEEKAVEQAWKDYKEGKYKTFKNADELIRYLHRNSK